MLPNCSDVTDPLECVLTGLQSNDKLLWNKNLTLEFKTAQQYLSRHKSIILSCPSDTLWIVTNGSVSKRGLGATLYVLHASRLHRAGFYCDKLRKHQVKAYQGQGAFTCSSCGSLCPSTAYVIPTCIFIELIYPSFKWDEAWNTAVKTCRDINKNMKVVNFSLICPWRQWVN